jgi:hypothetical protein
MSKSDSAKKRFVKSMERDYEKWHDGTGYDLSALDEMTESDRDSMVELLRKDLQEPWHSFEALAHINTPEALSAIKEGLSHPLFEIRIAASRFAKNADKDRERILIEALEKSDIYEGLTQALEQIETFHPQAVVDALLRGLTRRGDTAAVNFAGILLYIHGKADSPFDWDKRPFFLRFGASDPDERRNAFVELCGIIGVDPKRYL